MTSEGLVGKRYLITGGASGIGLAAARLLKARGARLALWDVDAAALRTVAQELDAYPAVVDVSRHEQVNGAMDETAGQLGGLDGVIHSAGLLRTGLFEAIDLDFQRRMIEVNLFGSVAVAYAALPHLRQTRGTLIFLGSTGGFYGSPEFATYGATKAAVLNLAQALRIEWASAGIHVGVATPLFVSSPMLTAENRKARLVQSRSPLKHIYTPEQTAEAIVRGIERRQFIIWTGLRPRIIFWLSRYASVIAHPIMRDAWK
jgi:short-subunit dehydrogenase